MIEEREIWACANLLLRQHGKEAWQVATDSAQILLDQGEVDDHQAFQYIAARIRELEATSAPGKVH